MPTNTTGATIFRQMTASMSTLLGLLIAGMGVASEPNLNVAMLSRPRPGACPAAVLRMGALMRLYGGADELPLWSFPIANAANPSTDWLHAAQGRRCHENQEMQLVKRVPADGTVADQGLRPRKGWGAEQYRQLEEARVHWWKGETEAADRAFLSTLSWYRSPAIAPPPGPRAAAASESNQDGPDSSSSQKFVISDGGLRWTGARPLSRQEHSRAEADTMCEYAAFLVEATAEREAAGMHGRAYLLFTRLLAHKCW
jgi:hypothetical protein